MSMDINEAIKEDIQVVSFVKLFFSLPCNKKAFFASLYLLIFCQKFKILIFALAGDWGKWGRLEANSLLPSYVFSNNVSRAFFLNNKNCSPIIFWNGSTIIRLGWGFTGRTFNKTYMSHITWPYWCFTGRTFNETYYLTLPLNKIEISLRWAWLFFSIHDM